MNPFEAPPDARDPARRLRGRLVAPVTVWTAGATGITVSSVLVAEGEPPEVVGLVGPLTDFWDAAEAAGRFVVHVLEERQVRLADQFAGRYPGDPFEGVDFSESEFGRILTDVPTRAWCELRDPPVEVGYFLLVRGRMSRVELGAEPRALAGYRGRYVAVADRRSAG